MEATKEDMTELAEMMNNLNQEDLLKLKGVITGIQLARDVEKEAG